MRVRNPDQLPAMSDALREAALVFGNGEVAWPTQLAAGAVTALTSAGHTIFGLESLMRQADGEFVATPLSRCDSRMGEPPRDWAARAWEEALDALDSLAGGSTHILIAW